MEYGGSDVSRCLYWLLQRSGALLPEINLTQATGVLQLQELKEAFCHMDQVCVFVLLYLWVFSSIRNKNLGGGYFKKQILT